MANPNPDLYTVRIGAKPVISPTTRKPVYGALTFEATRTPAEGKPVEVADPLNLLMRPGDSIQFEIGKIDLPVGEATLAVSWKSKTGKDWPDAPKSAGKPGRLPPNAGYGNQLWSYTVSLDLGANARLPAQSVDSRGNTVISIDPDAGSEEC